MLAPITHPLPVPPLFATTPLAMLGPLQGLQPNQQQNQHPGPQSQQQQLGQPNSIPPPPPQNGQDATLSNVLHFLQTEWRRYERDRNEWEIERAEMRVHFIFFFSGVRRVLNMQPTLGTDSSARGREKVLRKRKIGPDAPYKNARVRIAYGTVRLRSLRAHALA
jgi:hypothetical protein